MLLQPPPLPHHMQTGVEVNKTKEFHWATDRSWPCKWVNTWGMAEIHKRAAEDTVEYSLFPVIPDGKNSIERKKVVEEYIRSYLTFLSPQLIDVIWQNEGFNLIHVEEQGMWNRNEPKTSLENDSSLWMILRKLVPCVLTHVTYLMYNFHHD